MLKLKVLKNDLGGHKIEWNGLMIAFYTVEWLNGELMLINDDDRAVAKLNGTALEVYLSDDYVLENSLDE